MFPNLIAEDGNVTLFFTGVSRPSMFSWQKDFWKASDKSWQMTPDLGVVVAFWLKWLQVLKSKEQLLMVPGTLGCRKPCTTREPLSPRQALSPSCPSWTFSRVMHQCYLGWFFTSAFSNLWVLVAVSAKGNTPLSAPVWLFLVCTSVMWF